MEDNGYRVLEDITNTDNLIIKNMPIAIICKEGSMEQIRLAAGYDCVKDILFAPIEPQQLKRRIAAYRSKIRDKLYLTELVYNIYNKGTVQPGS